MSGRTKLMWTAVVLVLVIALAFALRHALSPRIIVRTVTPEGVELCVVQEGGGDFPPFVTSFVFRRPGSNWGWFYYDHEDWYWGSGRISLDTNAKVATVYRHGEPRLTFKWDTSFYTLQRPDLFQTYNEAGDLPISWAPGKKLE